MTIYETNCSILKLHHPVVWETVRQVETSRGNEVTRQINEDFSSLQVKTKEGKWVDLFDPNGREDDVEWVPEGFQGLVYLLGFGMGVMAQALMKKRPTIRNLVVVDLCPPLFVEVLKVVDLTSLLSDPRLILSIDPAPDIQELFGPCKNILMTESIYWRQHLPSISIDREAWAFVANAVNDHVNQLNIAGSTITVRGELFWNNRLKNLATMYNDSLLEDLQGAFAGKPAILIAAGPSLDKNIHLLKDVQENAVIIVADSALPAVVANGIRPHFVTTLDAFDFSFEKIAGQAPHADNIYMVTAPIVTPKSSQMFPASHVFWALTNYAMERWFCQLLGGEMVIEGAETVAHLSFFSALTMGCSPIIFVGQDFAYSTSESHASDTVLSSKEKVEKDFAEGEGAIIWVKGTVQEKVPTCRSYHNMKLTLERFMLSNPDRIYVNSTEGGAHIEGSIVLPLNETLNRHAGNKVDVSSVIKTIVSAERRFPMGIWEGIPNMLNRVDITKRAICRLEKKWKKLLINFRKIQKKQNKFDSFSKLPSSFQKELLEFTGLSEKIDVELDIWEFISDVSIECLKESERLLHQMSFLENQPELYLTFLKKQLERLLYINTFRSGVLDDFKQHLLNVEHKRQVEEAWVTGRIEDRDGAMLKLIDYYFDKKYYRTVLPLLEKLPEIFQDDPEILYKRGCIAAHRTKYEEASAYFVSACNMDKKFESVISEFEKDWGDEYLAHTSYFDDIDLHPVRRLLWKGLRCSPNHRGLQKKLGGIATDDLEMMDTALEKDESVSIEPLIKEWMQVISENKGVVNCLGTKIVAHFYYTYGRIMVQKGEFGEGIMLYSQSLEFYPENPYCLMLTADACFQQAEFGRGADYLHKAVSLDNSYAHHWINLAEHFCEQGMLHDAALAYEFFLKVFPGDADLLRRMQECCIAIGQPEAAEEAARKYGRLLPL